jgi:hypothetical protein
MGASFGVLAPELREELTFFDCTSFEIYFSLLYSGEASTDFGRGRSPAERGCSVCGQLRMQDPKSV